MAAMVLYPDGRTSKFTVAVDINPQIFGAVSVPPQDSPHMLGQVVHFHSLVKFGQILGQGTAVFSEA